MDIAKTKIERRGLTDRLAVVIATGGGIGFAPKAPGTAGALAGVCIYLLMEWLSLGSYYLHAIIGVLIAGVWASRRVEALWGHDCQRIVVDEIAGQMIPFAFAAGRHSPSALAIAAGFVLFRFFDIVKPFPLRRLEQFKGGAGVVLDDVGAGLYALGVLALIEYSGVL